jgi:hypothetical protein
MLENIDFVFLKDSIMIKYIRSIDDVVILELQQAIKKYPDYSTRQLDDLLHYTSGRSWHLINKFKLNYINKKTIPKEEWDEHNLNVEKLKKIILKYPQYTMEDLAKKLNLGGSTIFKMIKKYNLSYLKKLNLDKCANKKAVQDIINEYPNITYLQIKQKFGISNSLYYKYRK